MNGFSQNQRWYPYKSQKGDWFFLNENEERLNEQPFDSLIPFYREQAFVQRKGKWGVIDTSGKEIIPIQHQSVQFVNNYSRQFYLVGDKNAQNREWRWGVVNLKGDQVLPIAFQHVELLLRNFGNYSKPICFVTELLDSTNSKGLYDTEGNKLVEHEYEKIVSFPTDRYTYERDYCLVLTKQKQDRKVAGAYNVSGKNWIFPCEYGAEYVIDEWNTIRIGFNRRLWKVPLTTESFLYVYKGVDQSFKQVHHCYSVKGELLFECQYPEKEEGLFEFIYADSVVATSEWGFYDVISITPEVYQLSIMNSTGIASAAFFSAEKGIVVPPGIFKYNPNIELEDGKVMLTRILDGTWREVSLDGTISVPKRSASQLLRPKWINRETKFGSYRYNPKKKRIIVYDSEGKRRAKIKGRKYSNVEGKKQQFLYTERRRSFSIYNMEAQQFVFKNHRKLLEATRDSLYDEQLHLHYLQGKGSLFQLFSQKTGWAFYNENGQLLKSAPDRSLLPMHPLEIEGELGGIIFSGKKNGTYSTDYEIFSGVRLEGLDSVYSIHYDSNTQQYHTWDHQSICRGYDEKGKQLYSFQSLGSFYNGIAKVKTINGGFNLCDSSYQLLLDHDFSRIDFKGKDLYIGTGDSLYYFIQTGKRPIKVKTYTHFNRRLNSAYECFNPDGSIDVRSLNGDMLFENAISLDVKNSYFIVRTRQKEYWLTPRLVEYASHSMIDGDD